MVLVLTLVPTRVDCLSRTDTNDLPFFPLDLTRVTYMPTTVCTKVNNSKELNSKNNKKPAYKYEKKIAQITVKQHVG